jgi:hypothetical protein
MCLRSAQESEHRADGLAFETEKVDRRELAPCTPDDSDLDSVGNQSGQGDTIFESMIVS